MTYNVTGLKKIHDQLQNIPVEKEKILLVFGTEAHCKIPPLLWKKTKQK